MNREKTNVLFDSGTPKFLKKEFSEEFNIIRSQSAGWDDLKNGDLLDKMKEHKFKYLVTLDQNIRKQQNKNDLIKNQTTIFIIKNHFNNDDRFKLAIPVIMNHIRKKTKEPFIEVDVRKLVLRKDRGIDQGIGR